jgi:acyl carrier protein
MIPAIIAFLPKLPLTPNGKVDRQALLIPQQESPGTGAGYVAPRTELEREVAFIWAEVLGLRIVGIKDHFFELGGHSLMAVQVISRLRNAFHAELPLSLLFDNPSVETVAAALASEGYQPIPDQFLQLTPVSREGAIPASFMQEQLWFLRELEPASDAYNVPVAMRLKGCLDLVALQQAFDTIVRRHEALRTAFRFAEGILTQEVTPHQPVPIRVFDAETPESMLELLYAEARRPFHLEQGPLIRLTIARIHETDHALIIVAHHAVIDGWSLGYSIPGIGGGLSGLCRQKSASPVSRAAIPV